MSESLSHAFLAGVQQLGLSLTEQQSTQFLTFRRELLDWNTRMNLTAITDPEEVLIKHFLDSLSLLVAYSHEGAHVIDIGTGAGFPGLPLKIAHPDWQVTLLEATGKRVTFVRHVIEQLGLEHVEVVQGRAEDLAHKPEYRGRYDLVTARAVAAFSTLLEYCAPYCQVGGSIILPKKGDLTEELERGRHAAQQLGTVLQAEVPVQLPGLADGRRLFVWTQQKRCPAQFPRHGSAIAKRPLGQVFP
ncbi:MAG TPA: 16S rRNA (guanine(527)-N(7))-methyltransferase RsmG [Ktedonobacteraceae bacterium]|nr:16S rRNA (guanine(527)-N(7))-methyltransferase RsmG [Ktedonobacteraceae bacterium]